MNAGDVHWIQLPTANGHEQRGRRPAIILQDDSYAGRLPLVLVVPLTTAQATLRFPGTVLIESTNENGLRQDSVALVFQMRALDRTRIRERIGRLSNEKLTEVHASLDQLLGRVSPDSD